VELRERASVSSAEGVDIQGRCLTSTEAPRKVPMIWRDRRKIEAELSWGTLLLSHPKTKASLSVRSVTSLPTNTSGQHRKGSSRPTASRVEDLQLYAWSEESLCWSRKWRGKTTDAKNHMSSSSIALMETAPLSPSYGSVMNLPSAFSVFFGKSTLRRFPGLRGELKGILLGLGVFIK
jgi:hypothetical protein